MRFLAICTFAICLASSANTEISTNSSNPIHEARYLMGTVCEITVYPAHGQTGGREAIAAAFAELRRVDSLLSNWKRDSELMRANEAASAVGEPRPRATLTNELSERVELALQLADLTNGLFDPTVGPLVRAWGFLPRCVQQAPCEANISQNHAIDKARQLVGWQNVHLHSKTRELEFGVPGMELDMGGVAKGYAAERAADILREHGIKVAMVNLGSSSLKSIGMPPVFAGCPKVDGNRCAFWPVEISDPRDRHLSAATVFLRAGYGMATSGTYEKKLGKRAKTGSHLIDPATGQAVKGEISVTVIAPNAEVADALTKPFIIQPTKTEKYGQKLLQAYPYLGVLTLATQKGKLLTTSFGLGHVQNFTAATPTYLSAPP
jgi:FAD:protein FMN transferase